MCPTAREAEAKGLPRVQVLPGVHSELKASMNYTGRHFLKQNKTKQTKAKVNSKGEKEASQWIF